jgi:hypothetical protein
MSRPVPVPTALSHPFWAAAAEGRLVLPECGDCGLKFFVPEPVCPRCLGRNWEWVPSAGTGTVYSVTVVHRAPGPGFEVPFALAIVDLDDGVPMLSHVVGCPVDEVGIGLPVRVDFRPLTAELALPYFVPR